MSGTEWAKRLVVLCLVAIVVVSGARAGGVLTDQDHPNKVPDLPEYQPDRVSVTPLPAQGQISPDRPDDTANGTIVIDRAHKNRFDRATIQPLVRGLTRVGYDVEFYTGGALAPHLKDAKAFVVIDPAQEYKSGDADVVRKFTGQGGHLLIIGEPTRIRPGGGVVARSLANQESAVTTLTSSYGLSVGTAYLYNQRHADANYKFITTEPGPNTNIEGVNRTTMYTAAPVTGGTVLLRSRPGTLASSSDADPGQFSVAVRTQEVVLVGDKTFLGTTRYKVADNERFIEYLIEFLARSDRPVGKGINSVARSSKNATQTPPPATASSPSST